MRQGTLVVNGLLACLVLVVGTGPRAYGQKGRNEVDEGNRQFEKGKFEEARASYRKALGEAPGSPVATFNLGGSQYKLKEFSDAEESFLEAAQSSDSEVLGRAHYNLGNSLFRQGRVEESVEAFKQALRLNPNDHQAKHNLEFVLTQQQQQQQQEQQQQPQQDQTSEKDRDDQQEKNQQQEQEPQDQPSEDEGNQDQEGEEQEQSEETSAQQGARPEDENQEEQDQTPENQSQPQSEDENPEQAAQPQPGRLTREEASRLLEAIQEDLQSLRREQLKKLKQTRVEKDW